MPSDTERRPVRIQRKRTKGWKTPENTVYVGRPTQWGNPFKVNNAMTGRLSRQQAVDEYQRLIVVNGDGLIHWNRVRFNRHDVEKHLRGKNLSCWCPLDQPCHADVLLEIANAD